jgi:hypothetical protein
VTGLGQGYTVEEQITGNAKNGGFQFDIFPPRTKPRGTFFLDDPKVALDVTMTPAELNISAGGKVGLTRYALQHLLRFEAYEHIWRHTSLPGDCRVFDERWTLSNYRRRISPTAKIHAVYAYAWGLPSDSVMGVGVGGKM